MLPPSHSSGEPRPVRVPVATYRLQLGRGLTLARVRELVDYFHALGVSDLYLSPIMMARAGSLSGYDVVDPERIDPELGTEEDLRALAEDLAQRGMGLLVDVVPNHMCITDPANRWWYDVLENGQVSAYAGFFDIDWSPPKRELRTKVLLPLLPEQYGRVLENQEIQVRWQDGRFVAAHGPTWLPLSPKSWAAILQPAADATRALLGEEHAEQLELDSILTAIENLPPRTETDPERIKVRQREKEVIRRRVDEQLARSPEVRQEVERSLEGLNGHQGDPTSFDRLEALLADQAYRLSYWRVAADEINYRRFFDVNDLAAIRVERPEVFAAVHEQILRFVERGWVTGLRIDHPDGLLDPEGYLAELQRACRDALARGGLPGADAPFYVVAEKILEHGEHLRASWPASGTTGYEALNLLDGVFVDRANARAFGDLYVRLTDRSPSFTDLVYDCKKLVIKVSMSGEHWVLARRLDRISEQHRWTRDFTLHSLLRALTEIVACFPVYRSYIRPEGGEVDADDRRVIAAAVRAAMRRNPAVSRSIYDFIRGLLLGGEPLPPEVEEQRRELVLRVQQLTGPVMAKGLEDTAFYRTYPLVSLNEVGGSPAAFGAPVEELHAGHRERLARWPDSLVATSTHDTKRAEDVRARLNALSEIPTRWEPAVARWREQNRRHKEMIDDREAPDANEEYLLYQTLVGAWPLVRPDDAEWGTFVGRIQEYMLKALKEAKLNTSWISPYEEWDEATRRFITAVLERRRSDNEFLRDIEVFQRPIAQAGMLTGLSRTVLKLAAPGVPDFYQGTELWDLSLVDPDNRRPVDWDLRRRLLGDEPTSASRERVEELLGTMEDGRIKLHVTSRGLACRLRRRELFARGDYVPLAGWGPREGHLCAFGRVNGDDVVIAAAARFFLRLGAADRRPVGEEVWEDTVLDLGALPCGTYRDVFTGRKVRAVSGDRDWCTLRLAEVFAHLPAALLERVG
ncbi:MAG TPA: malto-oligosyltrehalose synthase [Polyangia bacterium]|jgi:(1->4)-alpha-D-glucan 1-alpha-D-glucosylmutase